MIEIIEILENDILNIFSIKMEYHAIFKTTLQELIAEVRDILKSGRYETPEILLTDLEMAKVTVTACTPEAMVDIMTTFGKFILQFESQIKKKDVEFFNRLEVCKACAGHGEKCICLSSCHKKCKCDAKCPNCSELLKDLDSKTFTAIKYIIGQAVDDIQDKDKKEDIDVIFNYISSLLAAAKNHKKR